MNRSIREQSNSESGVGPLKILCVVHEMALDGSGVYFSNVCRGLSSRGHEVRVVSGGGPLAAELPKLKIEHEELWVLRGRSRPPFRQPEESRSRRERAAALWRQATFFALLPASLVRLRRAVSEFRPTALYVHSPGAAWLSVKATTWAPRPIVAMIGSPWGADGASPLWAGIQHRISYCFFFSAEVMEAVRSVYPGLTARSEIFSPPVDSSRFKPRAKPEGQEAPSALLVSRIDADKWPAIERVLHGFARAIESLPELRLRVAGGGSHEIQLRELAAKVNKQAHRPAVEVLGPRQDIADLLADSSVFLGVGTAVAEALTVGVPSIVVGTASGGECPEYGGIVDAQSIGRLTGTNFTGRGSGKACSSTAIAEDLEALFSDSQRRRELRRFSRNHALSHFSLGSHLDRLESIFRAPSAGP